MPYYYSFAECIDNLGSNQKIVSEANVYCAKEIETIKTPGCWNQKVVGVFDAQTNEQVGSFHRNYNSFGVETFAPFRRDNAWYALYSKCYTGLSVMSLPDCKHLGSEATEGEGNGFCPVEVHIPRYQWMIDPPEIDEEELLKYPECNRARIGRGSFTKEYDQKDSCYTEDKNDPEYICKPSSISNMYMDREVFYEDFAIISGCVWGDDSSWKIELRDISKAHEGIITPIENWGYYQLAWNLDLKDAIKLDAFPQTTKEEETHLNIKMAIEKTVRLHTKTMKIKTFDD